MRERIWRAFCQALVRSFYRRVEVRGLDRLPRQGALVVCANHLSSLVDLLLLQAYCPRHLLPLARSGHFSNPLMWPLLVFSRAIPVYRRQDPGSDTRNNKAMFARCHDALEEGEVILIFPEGESHSEPQLKPLKTGAARIVLGAKQQVGSPPVLLPASLTFSRPGRFRSSVLIQIGQPIAVEESETIESEDSVRRLTERIHQGLSRITLTADSWEDIDFLNRIDRFYELRRGRRLEERPLAKRFRALRRLVAVHRQLRLLAPARIASVRRKMKHFERVCEMVGAHDYRLHTSVKAFPVLRHAGRTLVPALALLPLALWGLLTSGAPYFLVRHLAPRLTWSRDQLATSKVLLGLVLLPLFWTAEIALGWYDGGLLPAVGVAVSLLPGAAAALALRKLISHRREELRALLLLRDREKTRGYLLARRRELEEEIADLARIARHLRRPDELALAS